MTKNTYARSNLTLPFKTFNNVLKVIALLNANSYIFSLVASTVV